MCHITIKLAPFNTAETTNNIEFQYHIHSMYYINTCLCSVHNTFSLYHTQTPPGTQTHTHTQTSFLQFLITAPPSLLHTNTHVSSRHSRTSSILSPARRVPLRAAGLSGLMFLMKTPLIISPLLSLRPMPLPPIMLIPRD